MTRGIWHQQRAHRRGESTVARKFTHAWERARKRAFPSYVNAPKPAPEPTAHDLLVARIRAHKDEVKALRDPGKKP
jgi:hypothetical protein